MSSSVRTLVSSGRLDPITPPTYGALAAATLSDSILVVHENSGHGATLQSPCGCSNLRRFLTDPTGPQDTSCAATITTSYMIPNSFTAPQVSVRQLQVELAMAPMPRFRKHHW